MKQTGEVDIDKTKDVTRKIDKLQRQIENIKKRQGKRCQKLSCGIVMD